MRSSTKNTPPSDLAVDDNAFVLKPDAAPSDQAVQLNMATSTSLSAATPRTSRLLPHKPASMMETPIATDTLVDTKHLTYTADIKQFPETMDSIVKLPAKQSSQLDSMLLSKLPRELRDKIYRDAVVEDKDIPIHVTPYVTEDGERRRRRRLEIGHALMRACKQTRQEVADIYYLENTFRITNDLLENRVFRELSRLLTPWVQRMTELGVSHELVRPKGDFAKINFSIFASQGRIVVEPEPSSLQYGTFLIDPVLATRNYVTMTSDELCFCKIFKLARKHEGRDVVSWMQEYVDLIIQSASQTEVSHLFDPVHCWTCAGRYVI
jgi:hypothetical protein